MRIIVGRRVKKKEGNDWKKRNNGEKKSQKIRI
jgi:hypothetical protein